MAIEQMNEHGPTKMCRPGHLRSLHGSVAQPIQFGVKASSKEKKESNEAKKKKQERDKY